MSDSFIKKLYAYATGRGTLKRTVPGQTGPLAMTPYGALLTQPLDRKWLSLHGKYFVAHNPTNDAATTLIGHAAPVLADADATLTKPLLFARVPTNATKLVVPDFVEQEVVTAGASGTADNWAAQLDTGATRYSSGGVAPTIVNPNRQSTDTSVFAEANSLMMGAVVASAEVSMRDLGFGQNRAAIEFAGDRTVFLFGETPHPGPTPVAGAASRHLVNLPGVILGAQDMFLLAKYAPSQNAAGIYKLRMGWWELEL
jgi:hypothetical protein